MGKVIKFVNKNDRQEIRAFSDLAKAGKVKLVYRRPGFVQVMTPPKPPVVQGFDPEAA